MQTFVLLTKWKRCKDIITNVEIVFSLLQEIRSQASQRSYFIF